jgi:tetratricopeptide (TPR) repeat protein
MVSTSLWDSISQNIVYVKDYFTTLKWDIPKDFTTAIKYNPKNYEAYHRRALIKLESNGDFRDVIDDLNHVLDLNPRVQGLYCLRGHAWDQLGKQSYLKAKEYYNNAIYDYLKSNDIDHKTCYSRLESPDFCHTMGDFDLAIQYYSKIIETNPSQENAYALLALAYYEKKEFSKVILTIEKKYSCLDRIVSCFTRKEEYAQAIEFINMVIDNINNENLRRRCLYRRAQAKYDIGDCTDALSDFNKALPNGPTNILESGFLNKLKEKMKSKK